jgi:hypothetical protein
MTELRYRRTPRALNRTVGPEVVLAAADREGFDVLPGTAAAVWILLDEPATLVTVAEKLSALYDTTADRIAADVAPLLDELVDRGWLEQLDAD